MKSSPGGGVYHVSLGLLTTAERALSSRIHWGETELGRQIENVAWRLWRFENGYSLGTRTLLV